jgi:Ca2+-binding RTX toxin-like protein
MMARRFSVLCALCLIAVGVLGTAPTVSAATVTGDGDANAVFGTPGRDRLEGGDGDDYLFAGRGRDVLIGGVLATDRDLYFGGSSPDRFIGGPGEDVMIDDDGGRDDVLRAGAGDDMVLGADGARDSIDCGSGSDFAVVDRNDAYRNCEVVILGTTTGFGYFMGTNAADTSPAGFNAYFLKRGDDSHAGTALTQTVFPGRGADTITPGTGSFNVYDDDGSVDSVTGTANDDYIYSADGAADTIDCGAGAADTVYRFIGDATTNCEVVKEGLGSSIDL